VTTSQHRSTPEELRARLAAGRLGEPFLVYRTVKDGQQILTLHEQLEQATIGRGEGCAVRLELDAEVSRLHAELRRLSDIWVIGDEGLSRNGTFVNEERLTVRRRLLDGDIIRCGNTLLSFHDPRQSGIAATPATGRARRH